MRRLVPASNEKLLVTYAALVSLGSSYRFRTEVLAPGHQEGATWHGNVYLKGFGDPTLTSHELQRLAAQLKTAGIRRVDGRVVGDESWFDSRRTAPGWKSSFFLFESPPLSALVVDHGVYSNHLSLNPALAAAGRFKQLLRARGIVAGRASVGRAPAAVYPLAEVQSAALPAVLREMDRDSDNFTAELMLKQLGAESGGGGSTAAGAAVVLRDLAAAGVPLTGVRIADGSGLSLDDRLTARALVSLLVAAWTDPELRNAFWRGAAGRRRERHARGPDGTCPGARGRSCQDRDDEPGVGALGLRRRAVRLRDHPERLPGARLGRARGAGSLRDGARLDALTLEQRLQVGLAE